MFENVSFISPDGEEKVNAAIKAAVEGIKGFEVVEIRYFVRYREANVEVLVWKKGGVDLNDCEKVHNVLSNALDRFENEFRGGYNLSVSSMGLDRPVVSDDDYRRSLSEELELIKNDNGSIIGTLESYDGDTVTVKSGGKDIVIERKNLKKVQPYLRF